MANPADFGARSLTNLRTKITAGLVHTALRLLAGGLIVFGLGLGLVGAMIALSAEFGAIAVFYAVGGVAVTFGVLLAVWAKPVQTVTAAPVPVPTVPINAAASEAAFMIGFMLTRC